MKKIILALAVLALSSTSSFAERGDSGEGNGGGSGTPSPKLVDVPYSVWETQSVPRQVSNQVNYDCSYWQTTPAHSTGCAGVVNPTMPRFDDFASGCKIVPARTDLVPKTCQRTEVSTVYDDIQVEVVKYKKEWQCPSPYIYQESKDKHEVTRVCRRPESDRGNVGNR